MTRNRARVKKFLSRTTERPMRERGDSLCEIIFSVRTLWAPLAAISRGFTLWNIIDGHCSIFLTMTLMVSKRQSIPSLP